MEAVQQSSLKFHLVQDCVECSYAQIISSLRNHFPSNFQFLFLWRETKMLLFGWMSFVEQYLLDFSNRPSVFRFLSCSAWRPLCHRNAAAQICTREVKGLLKRGVCMVVIAGARICRLLSLCLPERWWKTHSCIGERWTLGPELSNEMFWPELRPWCVWHIKNIWEK